MTADLRNWATGFLRRLSEAFGPSGYEEEVRRLLEEESLTGR